MGVPPEVQPLFVNVTYSVTGFQFSYGSATLSESNGFKLYLQNYWVTQHLLVRHLKCSLCL